MKKRNAQLDVLRAIAIALVILRHAGQGKHNLGLASFLQGIYQSKTCAAQVLRSVLECGWVGVDLFFVLSGFLVSGLIFQEFRDRREIRPGRFLIRRAFKIYPPFYFLLAVTVLGMALAPTRGVSWSSVLCEAGFVQNYGRNLWGHTWSLAVEEHFYLLLAFLMFVLARGGGDDPFRALPRIVVAVAAVCLGLRIATSSADRLALLRGLAVVLFLSGAFLVHLTRTSSHLTNDRLGGAGRPDILRQAGVAVDANRRRYGALCGMRRFSTGVHVPARRPQRFHPANRRSDRRAGASFLFGLPVAHARHRRRGPDCDEAFRRRPLYVPRQPSTSIVRRSSHLGMLASLNAPVVH